jgi:hypothetical protein
MKLLLSATLFFTIGLNINQAQQKPEIKISTFNEIPGDLRNTIGDCGTGYYYLSKADKKNEKLICVTDYDIVLIYINNKPVKLKSRGNVYVSGKYSLTIKDGPPKNIGDETWTMKSFLVIKYENKIIWSRDLIGYGGC